MEADNTLLLAEALHRVKPGAIIRTTADGRRWKLRGFDGRYALCQPLDLSTAEKISRDDPLDLLSADRVVLVEAGQGGGL
jgi:hypothetical protein